MLGEKGENTYEISKRTTVGQRKKEQIIENDVHDEKSVMRVGCNSAVAMGISCGGGGGGGFDMPGPGNKYRK